MKKLAILGASGHGKVVADCAEECGWENIVFFDDAWPERSHNGHWPVAGDTQSLLSSIPEFDGLVVAIGNNAIRQEKIRLFLEAGAPIVSILHPRAVISRYAELGVGTVVFAGAVINVDVQIGPGGIINTGATVDHDCVLGSAVHISPGANIAGGVRVGDRTWVGIGAVVRQMTNIGCDVMVGAGAAVVCDVSDGLTVIGVPATTMLTGK